jgi:twitching motility two-component system response regulator PilG
MQKTDSLSRAIHAARAGQPALARFHCQQAAEMQSDDPLVWLWLAWLSDSPSSMYQCLQVAQKDARYSEIADAGIVFARALCGIETGCDGSPGENSDPSDGAASPLRISDTHEDSNVTNTVAALPEPTDSLADDESPTSQPESVDVAAATEHAFETDPEQQCVEALNELSSQVNGEEASGLKEETQVGDADAPFHPETDLFAVAQAMLGDSQDNEERVEGLAAGVSVTSDPWIVRTIEEVSEIDNTEIQKESAVDETTTDQTIDVARPAWAEGLNSCDDQSEWSAEDDEFIPVAESASAVGREALAGEENQIDAAAGFQSDFINGAQEAGVHVGAEQNGGVDDNKVIPTVLVVDDSPAVRKLVQMTLHGRGYNIVTAFDGVAAIKEIARHEPWLILLDINMPRLDGYQLCSLIRKHERTQHIPVVMLSGKDGVFDRIRGKVAGCTSYIAKPFAPEALIEEVEKHIGEHAGAAQKRNPYGDSN